MSIQTTKPVSRKDALDRIIFISNLFYNKKYRDLENNIFEDVPFNSCITSIKNTLSDYDILTIEELKYETIEHYSNSMLQDILDNRCFRCSYFNNYIVV